MGPHLRQIFDEKLSVIRLLGDCRLDLVANEGQHAALKPTEARELMLVEHFLGMVQLLELHMSRVEIFEQRSTLKEIRLKICELPLDADSARTDIGLEVL